MKNQTQSGLSGSLHRLLTNNKIVNTNIERLLTSLSMVSIIGVIFTVAYLGVFLYKLVMVSMNGGTTFNLPITGENLMKVYTAADMSFYMIAGYEAIKLALIGGMAFYFWKFAISIDNSNPFSNPLSRNHISAVATLSLLFFPLDVISTLHLSYGGSLNVPDTSTLGFFHWEYLFGAYFVNVFAIIFRRGSDLNNEMDLVI